MGLETLPLPSPQDSEVRRATRALALRRRAQTCLLPHLAQLSHTTGPRRSGKQKQIQNQNSAPGGQKTSRSTLLTRTRQFPLSLPTRKLARLCGLFSTVPSSPSLCLLTESPRDQGWGNVGDGKRQERAQTWRDGIGSKGEPQRMAWSFLPSREERDHPSPVPGMSCWECQETENVRRDVKEETRMGSVSAALFSLGSLPTPQFAPWLHGSTD